MRKTDPDQHRPALGKRSSQQLLALSRARHCGVSVLEVMMVLAIVSVMASSALPEMRRTIEAYRMRTAAADLMAAIHETRSQAIASGQIVTLLPTNGDWRQGWSIVIDRNANRQPEAGEPILASHRALPKDMQVAFHFTDQTAPSYIAYNSAGRSCRPAHGKAANFGTVSLVLGEQKRNIKINMLGRARMCDPDHESSC